MKISLRSTAKNIRRHLRRPVVLGIVLAVIFAGGGITMAATGHIAALKLIPGINHAGNSSGNDKTPTTHEASPTNTPVSQPTTPANSPSPSPTHSTGPATINGNVYGATVGAGEPGGVVAPSNKPLWLSATSLSLAVGQQSGPITVKVPESFNICYVSGGIPGIGLGPVYQSTPACGLEQTIFIGQATKPGTYTTHITATTENKVSNGKYLRYDGYIYVTVTSAPSFWLTAGSQQLTYAPDGTTLQTIKVTLTITRDAGYSGTPQITYGASSSWCTSVSLDPAGPNAYTWTCQPSDPTGHHMYTLNFYGNDTVTQRSAWTGISY